LGEGVKRIVSSLLDTKKDINYFYLGPIEIAMLCLKCGQREQFADNLCEECLLLSIKPVSIPPIIQGNVCRTCNKLQKGRSWVDVPGTPAEAAVHLANINLEYNENVQNPRVELSVDHADGNLFKISGKASSVYKGILITQDLSTEVRLHMQSCPWCSRQMGNYFEAILQIRGLDGLAETDIENLLMRIRDETKTASLKDPNVFITKEEKVRGGYDFYMGEHGFTRQLAQKLHDHYGGELKWSSSMFGRKDGKDVYRHTFLVRLPGFLVGDYLVSEKGKFRVTKIFKRVQLLDLATRREITVDLSDAMAMRAVRVADVEMDLVVIMQTETEVQVMHPHSMRPVDLIKYEKTEFGEKAGCVYIENELFLA